MTKKTGLIVLSIGLIVAMLITYTTAFAEVQVRGSPTPATKDKLGPEEKHIPGLF